MNEQRWQKERQFFNEEEYSKGPIPANTIERYMLCRKPYLPAEYPFWILGDVRGKRVLEIGSGDGGYSVLLALKGAAKVVGVDISSVAVEIARNRAQMHGVADRTVFYAMPLESYLEEVHGKFDVICGFAILHHLLPVLENVLNQLKQLAEERTLFLFSEPVSLSNSVRRLRMALPIRVRGTPDERPLGPGDLAILHAALPGMEVRLFSILLRLWARFIGGRYEDYPWPKRTIFDALALADRALLALPGLRLLASSAVMCADVKDRH